MKPKRFSFLLLFFAASFYFPAYGQTNLPVIRFIMLGDSITARGNWPVLLRRNDVLNQGVDGDKTDNVLSRMENVYRLKPRTCLIMIGINDILSGRSLDKIGENVQKIIDGLLKREITPIIQSTLYLAGSDPLNHMVETLNRKLKQWADERKVLYLELNQRLAPNGQLLPAYTNDGLHLNKAGYQAWKEELLKSSAFSLK